MSWQSSLTNDESTTWVALLVMWFISYSKLCFLARSRTSCSDREVHLTITLRGICSCNMDKAIFCARNWLPAAWPCRSPSSRPMAIPIFLASRLCLSISIAYVIYDFSISLFSFTLPTSVSISLTNFPRGA